MPKFIKRVPRARRCPLCKQDIVVDYKDIVVLKKHISERGKILARGRTGICSMHQRQMTRSIKRARYVALLPFAQN